MSDNGNCIMHPLKHGWVVYEQIQFYDADDKKKGYKGSFEAIYSFKNVESFWLNWNSAASVTSFCVFILNN